MRVCVLLFILLVEVSGVSRCYFCADSCEEPMIVQECTEEFGFNVQISCYTSEAVVGNLTSVTKGCFPTNAVEGMCEGVDEIEGVRCRHCNSDLCNDSQNDAEWIGRSGKLLVVTMGILLLILV